MNSKYWPILAATALLALLLISGCTANEPVKGAGQSFLTLQATDDSNHSILNIKLSVDNGTDALTAMKKVATVQTKSFLAGQFVTSINGAESKSDEYWALYVNGKYGDKSIDQEIINSDMLIEWKLEKITPDAGNPK